MEMCILVQYMNQTKMLVTDMDLVYATLYVGLVQVGGTRRGHVYDGYISSE